MAPGPRSAARLPRYTLGSGVSTVTFYGENVAHKLEGAIRLSDADVAAAVRARELYRERLAELMSNVDLVLTPTLSMVAPPVGEDDLALREELLKFTYPWNVIGAPALAMPCGPAEQGLPASIQLVGRPGEDQLVLAVGAEARTIARSHPRPIGAPLPRAPRRAQHRTTRSCPPEITNELAGCLEAPVSSPAALSAPVADPAPPQAIAASSQMNELPR